MKKRRKRRILSSLGVFSLLLAAGVFFFWFYWLAPARQCLKLRFGHDQAYRKWWQAAQKQIHRLRWTHDDFDIVGQWGGKGWVAWIMERVKPDVDIVSGRAGHKVSALQMMTNRDVGPRAQGWLTWWRANLHKKQEEWIREGFQRAGLMLHSPLTKENIRSLLLVIGKTTEGEHRWAFESPRYLRYNAMRWLRDTDFDPLEFSPSDLPAVDASAVLKGLILFSGWVERFPKDESPGVLAIGKPVSSWRLRPGVPFMQWWFVAAVYAFLAIAFGGGILCLRLATRKLTPRTGCGADDSGG